jgi:hypothetical protein
MSNATTQRRLATILDVIAQAVSAIPPCPDNARACHHAIETALLEAGLIVEREVAVVGGRLDLVAQLDSERVAIEIDRQDVRAKSIQKLLGSNGLKVAILHGRLPEHPIPGLDRVLAVQVGEGQRIAATSMPDGWRPSFEMIEDTKIRKPHSPGDREADRENAQLGKG